VAPARKQQAQVRTELPEEALPVAGNRYLLRQALLHLSLAVLTGVPKQGEMHVLAERLDGTARLRLYGVTGAAGAEGAVPEAETAPVPGFELKLEPAGALAQLWVARSILTTHGGRVRAAGPEGDDAPGSPRAYEVELTISGNPENGTKE
jgi:hypothetical protein